MRTATKLAQGTVVRAALALALLLLASTYVQALDATFDPRSC